MLNDLRFAVRVLLRSRSWTTVAIVSLALGIGATTALFSAASGLLLRTIPVEDPGSLVRLRTAGQNDMVTGSSDYGQSAPVEGQDYGLPASVDGQRVRTSFSYPMYLELRRANRTLVDLAASAPYGRLNVIADGHAELARTFICSGNYYQLLGISALRGRVITPDDDRPDAPAAAVISAPYWAKRFGSDLGAVGKVIRVGGVAATIVGVLPREFTGTERPGVPPPDVTLPLALDPQAALEVRDRGRLREPTEWWLQILGRLEPGADARQVQANLGPAFERAARRGLDAYLAALPPEARGSARNRSRTRVPKLIVQPASRGLTDVNTGDAQTVRVLAAVVALVLLIVCANVANLLLARASARQKEIAVRFSMGATRRRIVLQLLVESIVLAAAGGLAGAAVAVSGVHLLPATIERAAALDWRVLSFAIGVTMITGIAFGMLPALRATSVDVATALKEQSRSVLRSRSYAAKALLVAQVAVSIVLLVGAGVFLRTIDNLRAIEVGFNPRNLVLFDIDAASVQYDPERFEQLYRDIAERVGRLPGVTSVSFSRNAVLSGSLSDTSVFLPGRDYPNGESSETNISRHVVMQSSYFATMQIPLVAGRLFGSGDTASTRKVVVINQSAVRKFFPNTDPIGRTFGESVERTAEYEIVGVVGDARYSSLREPPPPTMYLLYAQAGRPSGVVFEARTARDPETVVPEVLQAIARAYPDLPIARISTQEARIEERFAREKLVAQAYAIFGGLALLLACIGLFGLMSYSVSQRTSEIGVRMALGADRARVLGAVMRESMILAGIGVIVGVCAAVATGRVIEGLLFGVRAWDLVSMAGAIAVLLAVAAVAAYVPARRASRVDPMVALRCE